MQLASFAACELLQSVLRRGPYSSPLQELTNAKPAFLSFVIK